METNERIIENTKGTGTYQKKGGVGGSFTIGAVWSQMRAVIYDSFLSLSLSLSLIAEISEYSRRGARREHFSSGRKVKNAQKKRSIDPG